MKNRFKTLKIAALSSFCLLTVVALNNQSQAQDTGNTITGYVCEVTYVPQYKLLSIKLSSQTYCGGTLYNSKSAYTQGVPLQNTTSTFYYTEAALMSLHDQVAGNMRSNRIVTINYGGTSYPTQIYNVKLQADSTP